MCLIAYNIFLSVKCNENDTHCLVSRKYYAPCLLSIMANEKDVFTEKKEVVTRLHEPLKFSVKAYKTQKEQGHYIEFTLNTDEFGVCLLYTSPSPRD